MGRDAVAEMLEGGRRSVGQKQNVSSLSYLVNNGIVSPEYVLKGAVHWNASPSRRR
jgi:hypothetical protein